MKKLALSTAMVLATTGVALADNTGPDVETSPFIQRGTTNQAGLGALGLSTGAIVGGVTLATLAVISGMNNSSSSSTSSTGN